MKKIIIIVSVILSLVMFASCATKAQAEPELEAAAVETTGPNYVYDVKISDEDPSNMAVILQNLDGYAWNPSYEQASDLDILTFYADNVQYATATVKDGDVEVIIFVFQALAPSDEFTFACNLKEEGGSEAVSYVVITISIDENHHIKVLETKSLAPSES